MSTKHASIFTGYRDVGNTKPCKWLLQNNWNSATTLVGQKSNIYCTNGFTENIWFSGNNYLVYDFLEYKPYWISMTSQAWNTFNVVSNI